MGRGETGSFEVTAAGGESVRAFVPAPLPPAQPLAFKDGLERSLEAAVLAVGRLDGVSTLLPDEALEARPILSLPAVCEATGLSFPAASSGMELLANLGIASEPTGKRRNRLFAYDRYLAILNDGTEAP